MLVQYDCYECAFGLMDKLVRQASDDNAVRKELLNDFLAFLAANSSHISPPELASYLYANFNRVLGVNKDHYLEEKEKSTAFALQLYKKLAPGISGAADPLGAAVKLAIAGNIIDYGATPDFDLTEAEKQILQIISSPHDQQAIEHLKLRISKAENILYILDNCGEAVFDHAVLSRLPGKVTIGVRGKPIFNDVTRAELEISGLNGFPCVDTGDGTPGVSLANSSEEFLKAMERADLIISKGQGNFESLEGAYSSGPIYFLFRVKCPVIAKYLGVDIGSSQIIGRNLS